MPDDCADDDPDSALCPAADQAGQLHDFAGPCDGVLEVWCAHGCGESRPCSGCSAHDSSAHDRALALEVAR